MRRYLICEINWLVASGLAIGRSCKNAQARRSQEFGGGIKIVVWVQTAFTAGSR